MFAGNVPWTESSSSLTSARDYTAHLKHKCTPSRAIVLLSSFRAWSSPSPAHTLLRRAALWHADFFTCRAKRWMLVLIRALYGKMLWRGSGTGGTCGAKRVSQKLSRQMRGPAIARIPGFSLWSFRRGVVDQPGLFATPRRCLYSWRFGLDLPEDLRFIDKKFQVLCHINLYLCCVRKTYFWFHQKIKPFRLIG